MDRLPKTMKAWVAVRGAHPRAALALQTRPTPGPPGAGQILVRVSHAALNPGDLKMLPRQKNAVIGMDFAGTVVQVGPPAGSTTAALRPGTLVAGTPSATQLFWHGRGTLCEYLVVAAGMAVAVPPRAALAAPAAAAGLLGVAGQTCVVVCRAAAGGLPRAGGAALVNGASGGVGSLVVQVLRGMGVRVTGVCSARNEALVRRLGAEEVVDYTAHKSLPDYLSSVSTASGHKPFDVIIDCVGTDELYKRSSEYLKPDGKYLCIESGPWGFLKLNSYWLPAMLGLTPRICINAFSRPSGASAKQAAAWFEKGWISEVPIDSIFEMNKAVEAYERLATKRAVGKILVRVQSEPLK